jgi:hypothetical protein
MEFLIFGTIQFVIFSLIVLLISGYLHYFVPIFNLKFVLIIIFIGVVYCLFTGNYFVLWGILILGAVASLGVTNMQIHVWKDGVLREHI